MDCAGGGVNSSHFVAPESDSGLGCDRTCRVIHGYAAELAPCNVARRSPGCVSAGVALREVENGRDGRTCILIPIIRQIKDRQLR